MCALIFMRKYMFHHCWNIYNIQVIVTITSTFLGHRQGQCPSRKNFSQRVAFSWRVWRDGRTVKLLKYICAYFHPNCAKFLPLLSSFFWQKVVFCAIFCMCVTEFGWSPLLAAIFIDGIIVDDKYLGFCDMGRGCEVSSCFHKSLPGDSQAATHLPKQIP